MAVFVGQNAHWALREAADYLRNIVKSGDLVLLKGSNKVDHLERLVLDRQLPIHCWRERCGFDRFCEACPWLYYEEKCGIEVLVDSKKVIDNFPSMPSQQQTELIVPVIVGLGNPGKDYQGTLHNIGYHILDTLAAKHEGVWQAAPSGSFCDISLAGKHVRLFKADS